MIDGAAGKLDETILRQLVVALAREGPPAAAGPVSPAATLRPG